MGTGRGSGDKARRCRGRAAGHRLAAARGRRHQRRDGHPPQHHGRAGAHARRDERGRAASSSPRRRIPTPTSSSARSSTPHAGDEVRITVIATGFQTRESVQPGNGHLMGRSMQGARGGRENQMALPMQPTQYAVFAAQHAPQPHMRRSRSTSSSRFRRRAGSAGGRAAVGAAGWLHADARGYAVAPGRAEDRRRRGRARRALRERRADAGHAHESAADGARRRGIATASEWTPAERLNGPAARLGAGGVASVSRRAACRPRCRVAPGRRAGRRGVGVRQADVPAPRHLRA